MSFFGFNGSGHNTAAPGFSQTHDPFAGLANSGDDGDALEFEETYDGLGDQLDETGDAFNDDTFGGGPTTVAKDFDFFGQTAKVADAIEEEHLRFNRHQPPAAYRPAAPVESKPRMTGYEGYREPEPELQVDAALWGVAPKKPAAAQAAAPAIAPASRKIMSLEEVEAAMRAQSKKPAQHAPPAELAQPAPSTQQGHAHHQFAHQLPAQSAEYQFPRPEPSPSQAALAAESGRGKDLTPHHGHGHPVTILQRPQSKHAHSSSPSKPPQHQQQQQPPQARRQAAPPVQPTQILQNPNRLSGDPARAGISSHPPHPTHHRQQSSLSLQPAIITHPSQLNQLSEEEKLAYLEQEARRAKRNHKIYLLSKDNGIMTPQDKNFITRIQLQQLVAATGNPNEHGNDDSVNEDFYYQVHNQIRGGHRQHPSQPLNNFAQTYLFQTGSRQPGMRRHHRGPENHMQRMEQQVQRAVEAAKKRPKDKQLVIEGSLGKISFSNAKTPKPLLNFKRQESGTEVHRPTSAHKGLGAPQALDRKTVLRDIEKVYSTLMKLEDHHRKLPPPPADDSDLDLMQSNVEWQEESQQLNEQLWTEIKVLAPIGETPIHPFIAFLSFSKGKKAIPRVFRYTTHQQRRTILTMIVYHLDQLDVVRAAQINTESPLNAAMRENIELFQLAVMNSLFNFMNEVDLTDASGALGIISSRQNVDLVARTRIGVSVLTMILSRAAIMKHSGGGSPQEWQEW